MIKCPKCGSDDFNLGDYSEYRAYDDVLMTIDATDKKCEGFSVWAKCNKCSCEFTINFQMTGTEIIEETTR